MQIKLGKIANPFTVFAVIWTISLSIYLLEWSDVFPKISTALFVFLFSAIVIMAILGVVLYKLGFVKYIEVNANRIGYVNKLFIFNLFCWFLNFVYSGGIPLLSILRGADIDIHEFGIPTFKVFTLSFNSYLCVYLFHHYLSTNKYRYLLGYAVNIMFFVFIFSRGLIMMTIVSTFFLWLLKKDSIDLKKIVGIIAMFLVIVFLFGLAGNIRTAKVQTMVDGIEREYGSDMILDIGKATEDFRSNMVPNEFFWGFLYIASPISNLQYNLSESKPELSVKNAAAFVSNEMTYDFISKRMDDLFNIPKVEQYPLIVPQLSVCTTFTGSFIYFGWPGLIIFLGFLAFLPLVCFVISGKNSPALPEILCILASIYFFSFFDNMFIYSGLGLQIVYPILFKYFKLS